MAGRKPKKNALTPQHRWNRHLAKMARFYIKRQYYRASAEQREQIRRLQIELGCSSREELVLYAINLLGQQHGIYLKDIQEDCVSKQKAVGKHELISAMKKETGALREEC
ncbi:hypothetical protein QNE90_003415 [Vibrio alginolyticus]|nr:hypothetical protein [Vibrio alginolyticus]